jgi:hypothetical protein
MLSFALGSMLKAACVFFQSLLHTLHIQSGVLSHQMVTNTKTSNVQFSSPVSFVIS